MCDGKHTIKHLLHLTESIPFLANEHFKGNKQENTQQQYDKRIHGKDRATSCCLHSQYVVKQTARNCVIMPARQVCKRRECQRSVARNCLPAHTAHMQYNYKYSYRAQGCPWAVDSFARNALTLENSTFITTLRGFSSWGLLGCDTL